MADQSSNENSNEPNDEFFDTFFDDGVLETIGEVLGHQNSGTSHDESSCEAQVLHVKDPPSGTVENKEIILPQTDSEKKNVGSHADEHHIIILKPAHLKDPFENTRTEDILKESVKCKDPKEMVLTEIPGTSVEMAAASKNNSEKKSSLSLNQLLAKVQTFLKETPGSEIKSSENSNKLIDSHLKENQPPLVVNRAEEEVKQVTTETSETHNKQLNVEGIEENAESQTVVKNKCESADTEQDVNASTSNQIGSSGLSSSHGNLSSNECLDIASKESLLKKDTVTGDDLSLDETCLKNDNIQSSSPGKRNKININLKSQILASTSILNSGSSTNSEPLLSTQGSCNKIPSKSHHVFSDMSSTDDSDWESKKKKKKRMKRHSDRETSRNSKSSDKERSDLKSNEAHEKQKKKKRKNSPEYRRNRDYNKSSKRKRSPSPARKNMSRKEYKRGTSPNPNMRNKRWRSPFPNRYPKPNSHSPSRHRSRSRSKSPVRYRSRKSPSPKKNRRRSRSRSRSPFINEIRRLERLWEQEDEKKKSSFNSEPRTEVLSTPLSKVPTWHDGGTTSTAFVSKTVVQMQSASFTFGPSTDHSNPAYQEGPAALLGPEGHSSYPVPQPNLMFNPYGMPPIAAHTGVSGMVSHQSGVSGLAPHQSGPGVPGVGPYPVDCAPPLAPQMVPPPSSIISASNNISGQQSILKRQLDILLSVMPPGPMMPPAMPPVMAATPMLHDPINNLRPSLKAVEIENIHSPKNIYPEPVNTESPSLELMGSNSFASSSRPPSKSNFDDVIEKSSPHSRETNSQDFSKAIDNSSSESHKSKSGEPSNNVSEVLDIPQLSNSTEYQPENEDIIGVPVEDYDSDIIIEEPPPKPPIELICLSGDEGETIVPEVCDKIPDKNDERREIHPSNEEGTSRPITIDSTSPERECAMTEAPPSEVLVTSVSPSLQTLNQTSKESSSAKQSSSQVLPIENASPTKHFDPTKSHKRKYKRRRRKSSLENKHVGKENRSESDKFQASNEDQSQEPKKNCESHKIHPTNEESMAEVSEVRSESICVQEPTSQETSSAATVSEHSEILLIPESRTSQTLKEASNEINMEKQTSPQVISKESQGAIICLDGSPMKECESLEYQTRKQKRKKRKRSSSEDKRRRRLGKENQKEPKNLLVSNQDECQESVLRECREMIDSLRIGRFAVKDQDCGESEKNGNFLPKEPTGSNSLLLENIVHFSYTKNLKPESLPKVKDVSTNTTFRLCLDVCTNTDTNETSKDCMLQTDFECPQCTEKKDLIRDMNAQLMKLKKERDDLLAIVVGLGKFQTIPGLDCGDTPVNDIHHQSGSEFTSAERVCVKNGPSLPSEQTNCNFELMPPAEPIFAYDYNHSSPSRSGGRSKTDSFLCPKKPFQ